MGGLDFGGRISAVFRAPAERDSSVRVELRGVEAKASVGTLNAKARSSLTRQFFLAAAMQAQSASDIETIAASDVTDEQRDAHRGFVVAAIMMATAALESEIWEVMTYGPGHHLGSNGLDENARGVLAPLAETFDREAVLDRYDLVLHVLGKSRLPRGNQPWQDTAMVVKLRNELVHYKSKWSDELERNKFFQTLERKGHRRPPFFPDPANFFPHGCLSAECAAWAADSSVAFFNAFYERLGIPSPLASCAARLVTTRPGPS